MPWYQVRQFRDMCFGFHVCMANCNFLSISRLFARL
jgi:hypothetical protein